MAPVCQHYTLRESLETIDDDDHENAREQNPCYRSQVAPFENGIQENRNSIAFDNARGIALAITHANFVVATWFCGDDLRVLLRCDLTMTRCNHRVDESLPVVTPITRTNFGIARDLKCDRSCAQLEGIPRAGFVSGTWRDAA